MLNEISPNELLIFAHYQRLRILPAAAANPSAPDRGGDWCRDRIHRLCRWITCTPSELAALAAVTRAEMSRYMKANRFPSPVALHFAIIESWYLECVAGLPQEPIVPIGLAL